MGSFFPNPKTPKTAGYVYAFASPSMAGNRENRRDDARPPGRSPSWMRTRRTRGGHFILKKRALIKKLKFMTGFWSSPFLLFFSTPFSLKMEGMEGMEGFSRAGLLERGGGSKMEDGAATPGKNHPQPPQPPFLGYRFLGVRGARIFDYQKETTVC